MLATAPRPARPALTIDLATDADHAAVERLLDRAFGPRRRAKTAERLREGRAPASGLAFVLREGEAIVGTLTFWDIDAGGVPAVLLGPIAIDGARRSAGLGARLIRHGLDMAAARGHGAVLLVGDEPYYRRFGFSRGPVEGLTLPGPVDIERFLGLELAPGALDRASGLVRATGRPAGAPRKARRRSA